MKRFAVRSLAFALALAAGTVAAQNYYDDRGPVYDEDYAAQDQGYYAEDAGYYGQADAGYYGQQPTYADPRVVVRGNSRGYGANQIPAYDTARVLSVAPIVQAGQPVSRQQCWSEPSPAYAYQDRGYQGGGYQGGGYQGGAYQSNAYQNGAYQNGAYQGSRDPRYARSGQTLGSGALIGAIAGGVLGNSVGDGDGRKAATVIGAVLGGTIGNNIQRNGRYRNDPYAQGAAYPQQTQRCRTVTSQERNERVVGYRVGYEYAGRQYQTVTDYHPGSEIRVRVDVSPAG